MECPICFEPLENKIYTITPCKHVLCLHCLLKLKKKQCPMCRFDLQKMIPTQRENTPRIKIRGEPLLLLNDSVECERGGTHQIEKSMF